MLSINENAVKKLKEIHPYIKKVFTKSDNARCYHTSHSPEALYQICRRYDIELLRYDSMSHAKEKINVTERVQLERLSLEVMLMQEMI